MKPDQKLDEFVSRFRAAAGANLESIILYGSAASGEFQPKFSNLNLFCVLGVCSLGALQALAPAAKWWDRQRQPPPLLMTRKELERSIDVFPIEMMDMVQHYRVLFGADVLQGVQIPRNLHRIQVEYELREKLILLRQQLLLVSGKKSRSWDVLLRSAPSFLTLFRHSLIALGQTPPAQKRDAVLALARQAAFDPSAIIRVLDVREHKIDRRDVDLEEVCAGYLIVVEQVADFVDKMLDSDKLSAS
jgi:hypothetical protein